jgi:hypothetical protein
MVQVSLSRQGLRFNTRTQKDKNFALVQPYSYVSLAQNESLRLIGTNFVLLVNNFPPLFERFGCTMPLIKYFVIFLMLCNRS